MANESTGSTLSSQLVAIVAASLNGKRREKFLESIATINQSLAQGAWTTRGSTKAGVGFYQGLRSPKRGLADLRPHKLDMCVSFGSEFTEELTDEMCDQMPDAIALRAWIELCSEVAAARKTLDAARPMPRTTTIGLSPKVTKTLQECALDLDIASIKPAEIKFYELQARNRAGELSFYPNGEPQMERIYYVAWSKGCVLNRSRFAYVGGCEACGKHIPSRRFVAIEADCKKLRARIGMYVGCDCAKNIFGIQDVGLDKEARAPA